VINNLAGAVFDVQGDQIFKHRSGFPATTINNAGTFRKSAGSGTASIAAVFNNTGTVEVLTGTLSFPQFPYTQTAGATVLNGGNLTSTQTLNIQGGILAGVGTVSGNVNNAGGQVNPGGSPGIFNITGNYTQGGSGALNIEIGGLTVGSQFDRLQISGAATLNGTLNISLINSFVPSEGDSFQVLTFGSRSGDFATYNGLDIDGRLRFEPSFTANSLVLNVALAPNSPPDAVNDTPTTAEDTPVTINVLSNDTDPNLDLLTVSSVTQGSNGMVTINANTTVTYTPTLNFNGTDMFTYTVSDGRGGTDTATVTVTVTPVNDAPDAINDSDTTLEDTPVAILVLSNDSDVDGDTLTLVSVTQAGHGTVVNNGDGTVTYTPNLNFNGTDSFSYMISDGNGGTDTAIVGVTVTPTGDPPNAVNDTETTAEDTAVDIAVLANDSDPDNDTITLISVTNGSRGTVTINPNGTVRYTPSLNFNGTDTFTYTISDGDGATDAATVTVTVTPVPDPPNAENDTRTTPEDTAINIAVLANDSDPDGDSFSLTSVTQGAHGSVTLNANGTVTYTPNLNFNGSDSFTYTISGSDGTDTATVTVNVTPVNDPPDAVDDTATAVEETDARIVVRSNDSDVDGDPITVISVTQGSNGQVFLNADQTVTYLPNLDFNGIDTFTYTISDSHGVTDTATVTVTVIPVNDKPVANNDSFNTDEDMVLTMPAPGVLGNDSDVEMDALMAVLVTAPSNGSLMFNPNGAFAYTPNAGFNGTDSFTYKANDGSLDSDVATVTINVGAVNDAPVAVNDSYSVNEDSTLNVAAPGVLSNDSDEDVDALTAVLVSGPTRGMLTLNSNGSFSYTPNANFNGTDAFSYKANDGQLDSNVATVTITVNAVNDPPVAVNDAATTPEETVLTVPVPGVLGNDADVDGNALTAMLVNEPANGTLTLNANGSFTYTPNLNFSGIDSFTYKANDGTADSNVATVTVTVLPGNHPPVAANDSYSVNEDVVLTVPAPGVLSNDSDEEGVALTAVLVSGPSHGSLTLNSNGSFTYTPNANFNGTDSFTYRANDGELDSPVATVTITINPVNDAPVAVNDSKSTNEDTALTFPASDLTANDSPGPSNESSQTLTVTAVSATANTHGIVSLIAGNITYMPTANFNGSASFTYTVSDGQGGSDTATVTVTVTPVNDVPDAVNDAATTNQNTAVDIAVLANDIDVDDDTLMVVSVTQGANGSVGINANGTVRYAPSTNFSGTDSFTYTINDGHGGTDTATVTITVIQTNMPPTANAGGPYNVNEGGSVVVTASGSDPESGPLTFAWDLDNNGTFETPGQSATFSAAALDGPSTRTITVRVTDNGGLSATAQTTVNVLNVAPTVGPITAPVDPIEVGTSISASAGFTDPGVGDTHTAVWKWGDGSTSAGSVSETNGSGSVRGNHPYTAAGVYTVGLTVTDDDGGSGQSFFQYVVVFDPSAGFVTGGGWIDSPAGAYAANPSLTGKANFGFVAKFKPGSSQVIGETEFNFPTAGLNFHSTGYDWLVITGPKAQFKGSGRINRTGDYAFLVTINDGQATGGGGVDKVRIKIWNKATGEVVYDNQRGDPDDANATDEIEGGSIVIHNR
jgi:VCBS repeat-containing protein